MEIWRNSTLPFGGIVLHLGRPFTKLDIFYRQKCYGIHLSSLEASGFPVRGQINNESLLFLLRIVVRCSFPIRHFPRVEKKAKSTCRMKPSPGKSIFYFLIFISLCIVKESILTQYILLFLFCPS